MSVKVLQAFAGPFLFPSSKRGLDAARVSISVRINDQNHHYRLLGSQKRFVVILIRMLWIPIIFFSIIAGSTAEEYHSSVPDNSSLDELTFGSQVILTTLWTPEMLSSPSENQNRVAAGQMRPLENEMHENPPVPVAPKFQQSIRSVIPRNHEKFIALTFDLCESSNRKSGYDADVVNYLREHRVKATFFAGGLWMISHPEKVLQLMADPLFEIGNHSWSHANFRKIVADQVRNEILKTQHLYESYRENLKERVLAAGIDPLEMNFIPSEIRLFRFPYGICTPQSLEMLKQLGLPAIQWNVVSGDPDPDRSPSVISDTILQKSRPGSIIICHANGRGHGTSRALPLFIPALRNRGFVFVSVSELLNLGTPVAVRECYEIAPGDNQKYDKPHKEKLP